jgi:hypothetical protein
MSKEKLILVFKNEREWVGFKNLDKSNRVEHPTHAKFII